MSCKHYNINHLNVLLIGGNVTLCRLYESFLILCITWLIHWNQSLCEGKSITCLYNTSNLLWNQQAELESLTPHKVLLLHFISLFHFTATLLEICWSDSSKNKDELAADLGNRIFSVSLWVQIFIGCYKKKGPNTQLPLHRLQMMSSAQDGIQERLGMKPPTLCSQPEQTQQATWWPI